MCIFDTRRRISLKSTFFRICAALMATVLLFSLAACGKKADGDTVTTTTATTTTTTTPTTAPPVRYLNLLTGENALETQQNRPVAFMIGNYGYTGAPFMQKNIDKADLYVEAETEGGIGRIMAVFGSIENVPAEVGPVRSARTHFVKLAKSLDVIYCHVGGSTKAKSLIPSIGLTDLDSLTVTNTQLRSANGGYVEHGKVFTLAKMQSAIKNRGIRTTTSTTSPFAFGEKAGSGKGNGVQVNISGSWKVAFTYDAATGLYTKRRSSLSSDVHKTIDGDSIQVKNVIVMYDTRYQEDAGHISFNLKSGNGVLVSGGTSRSVRWSRTDSGLSFTEADGTALTVAQGKTYICLTDTSNASKTVLQ